MLIIVAFVVATVPPPRLLDLDVKNHIAVFDVYDQLDPDADGQPATKCHNEALGKLGESLVVVTPGKSETIVLAEFNDAPPCTTKADVVKARANAKIALQKRGLDIDRKSPPPLTALGDKGTSRVTSTSAALPESNDAHIERTTFIDDVPVHHSDDDYSMVNAGKLVITSALAGNVLVETLHASGISGDGYSFRLVAVPKQNNVDIAALKAVTLPPGCAASIVGNAAVVDSVGVTVAFSLSRGKDQAPIAAAKAERATSVVYASPACTAAAKDVAAHVPGGATVELLTWKASGGVVVALGASSMH
ncbi:MAG TPA: hypothetical protein VGO62_12030 [Myxococcota bacterium]